jgi:hypothetical protein
MEQYTFKIVNNCMNTKIYYYLETSGGQISDAYLNALHFFNTRVNHKIDDNSETVEAR